MPMIIIKQINIHNWTNPSICQWWLGRRVWLLLSIDISSIIRNEEYICWLGNFWHCLEICLFLMCLLVPILPLHTAELTPHRAVSLDNSASRISHMLLSHVIYHLLATLKSASVLSEPDTQNWKQEAATRQTSVNWPSPQAQSGFVCLFSLLRLKCLQKIQVWCHPEGSTWRKQSVKTTRLLYVEIWSPVFLLLNQQHWVLSLTWSFNFYLPGVSS